MDVAFDVAVAPRLIPTECALDDADAAGVEYVATLFRDLLFRRTRVTLSLTRDQANRFRRFERLRFALFCRPKPTATRTTRRRRRARNREDAEHGLGLLSAIG